ncbi:endonuclease/exonuclease/phosphatase family protein [Roseibium aestuarii]|uniref:Endonuclease/exonuclease/phosphatase family protein n=1 Tax=Roseibium aestuarii TaxID=2600299 RepID=A0ABW4JSD4_9HYPH|nr:endonuclease/exonuclease/phosphatase family protein [Roseibium aestuarii]
MIRIASYNIQKSIGVDGRRQPERTLKVLGELGCDIIALQEADRRFGARHSTLLPERLAEACGFHPVPLARHDGGLGWHGNAILVRDGICVRSHSCIDLPQLEPRGAVMADLEIDGRRLRVAATHLSLVGHFRQRQIERLMQILHPDEGSPPTVLVGDLNEWREEGRPLRAVSAHYTITNPGKSFPSPFPVASLDRIMTSADLPVLRSGVHRSATARIASDHLPVWADLDLPA